MKKNSKLVRKKTKDRSIDMSFLTPEFAYKRLGGVAYFTVDDWLGISDIDDETMQMYPNAKTAQKIKDSKLYKVMK